MHLPACIIDVSVKAAHELASLQSFFKNSCQLCRPRSACGSSSVNSSPGLHGIIMHILDMSLMGEGTKRKHFQRQLHEKPRVTLWLPREVKIVLCCPARSCTHITDLKSAESCSSFDSLLITLSRYSMCWLSKHTVRRCFR